MIIHVRLREGLEDDIVAWYEAQDDKSGVVREALRAYMRLQNGEGQEAAIREAVNETLRTLPALVATAVHDALASHRLAPLQQQQDPDGEDPELAARLDGQLDDFFGDLT